MSDYLKTLNVKELVALKECADIVCEKYKNLYEMRRGNQYADSEESKDTLKEMLAKLNLAEERKNKIILQIEEVLENV